jgi:hypothetical protein
VMGRMTHHVARCSILALAYPLPLSPIVKE